jgi:hypothetical protein
MARRVDLRRSAACFVCAWQAAGNGSQCCTGCALQGQVNEQGLAPDEPAALGIVEALLAAGYRPTVYRQVEPPYFMQHGSQVLEVYDPFDYYSPDMSPRQAQLHAIGPWHSCTGFAAALKPSILAPMLGLIGAGIARPDCCRLVFVARGGTWSPSTHHHWPEAFKAAARTLLLAASRTSGGTGSSHTAASAEDSPAAAASEGGSSGPHLAALPVDELLCIIQLAAVPMSAWLA